MRFAPEPPDFTTLQPVCGRIDNAGNMVTVFLEPWMQSVYGPFRINGETLMLGIFHEMRLDAMGKPGIYEVTWPSDAGGAKRCFVRVKRNSIMPCTRKGTRKGGKGK